MNNKICLILEVSSPCRISKMGQVKKPKAEDYIALLYSWLIFSFVFWTEELTWNWRQGKNCFRDFLIFTWKACESFVVDQRQIRRYISIQHRVCRLPSWNFLHISEMEIGNNLVVADVIFVSTFFRKSVPSWILFLTGLSTGRLF